MKTSTRLHPDRSLAAAALTAALLTFAAGTAQAASPYTWNKLTAGPFNWDNASSQDNWGQGTASFPNTIGDVANMNVNLSANQVVNLNQAITVGSLTLGDTSGAQTATLQAGTSGSLIFDVASGNASLIRTAGGTGQTTISGDITLNDNLDVSLASGTASSLMVISGSISGSGQALTKTNSTLTLTLSGANNTYSGGTFINAGALQLNNTTAAGTGTIYLGATSGTDAAELRLTVTSTNPTNDLNVRLGSSGTKSLANRGGNSVTYVGNITANDDLTIFGAYTGGRLTVSGTACTIAAGKTVSFNNTGSGASAMIDNAVWGGGGKITYTSSTVMGFNIGGAKTYSGGCTLGAMSGTGILIPTVSSTGPANAPTDGPFGIGTLTIGATQMRGGTTTDTTLGNPVTFSGNPNFPTVASEKSLIFTGDASLVADRTLTVETGSTVSTAAVEFSGVVSGSTFGITKAGAGTLRLTGANTYSGATIVNAGKLVMSSASATATGAATVSANTTLGVIASGTSQWPPASLTLGDPCTLEFSNVQNPGTTTAPLAPSAAVGAVSGVTIHVNSFAVAGAVGNSYPLLGNVTSTSGYTLATQPANCTGHLAVSGSTLVYVVDSAPDVWAGTDGTNPTWWDIGTTANWIGNAAAGKYTDGDSVLFDDSASTSVVELQTAVAPGSVTFANSTTNFTVAASGANVIGGSTSLTKSGTGTVTLAGGAHTYNGTTTINAGTLQLGDGTSGNDATIANSTSVVNNSALVYNRFGSSSYSGVISSSGTVTKIGAGTQTLSGPNTCTGKTSVNGGTLGITNRTSASGYIAVGTAGSGATVLNLGAGNNFTFSSTGVSRIDAGGDAGASAADSGTIDQTAGDIAFVSGGGNQLLVGFVGTGTYNLSGGSLTTTASTSAGVTLGVRTNSTATFNLSGTGSLQMEAGSILQIGRSQSDNSSDATTLFNQTGGVANVGILSIGGVNTGTERAKRGTHTLTVTGGTFTANTFPRLAAADGNTAIINIGGTADVTLPDFPTARGSGATATLNLDGGILRNSASGTFITGLTNAYIQDGGVTFDTSSNSTTISQDLLTDPVSTGGGLTKQGANTLTLTGTNTYTGDTTLNAGVLAITGTSIADTGKLVINGGGILDLTNTETVNTLFFGAVQQPAGNYSASSVPPGATITTASFTGSGTLTVSAPSDPYTTWSGGAAFNVDSNNDGVKNGLAWLLGAPDKDANALDRLPKVSQSGGGLIMKFTCLKLAGRGTATLSLQHSSDLGLTDPWFSVAVPDTATTVGTVVFTVPTTNADPNLVDLQATIPNSEAAAGKLFCRLHGENP